MRRCVPLCAVQCGRPISLSEPKCVSISSQVSSPSLFRSMAASWLSTCESCGPTLILVPEISATEMES